ncbi:MAG: bifunctional precorrin-2 dehydrogenase/sirohydrochlorin ferrochelatase [Dehalococcoidia bacterium]|nr:MAG: bifunctional precorrin-2 dehydrogenase/sirohydrochlorin ferrochelatase [Dehalococcoidia bacterium]
MTSYYPVFLDLKGRKCVVVGGGSVAERKVGTLLEYQASVTVISPELSPGLQKLAERNDIQTIRRQYRSSDLKDAFLVIAATDNVTVNSAIAKQGTQYRALVNVVDAPRDSSFIVPSVLHRGDITIAIGTAGKSPALARKLRTALELVVPPEYASVLTIVSDARQELARRQITVNGDTWQKCLDIDFLLEMVKKGKLEGARERLLADILAADESSS